MPWAEIEDRNLGVFYRISVPGKGESVDPTLDDKWDSGGNLEIDQTKPTILCLHIQVTDTRIFRSQFSDSRLYEHFNIIAVDFRGHGYSHGATEGTTGTEEPYSEWPAEKHAEDMIAFMDALRIPHAFCSGHSFGAIVAVNMAFDFPNRVDGLILVGVPQLDGDTEGFKKEANMIRELVLEERQDPAENADALLAISFPDLSHTPYREGEWRRHCYRMYKDSEFPFHFSFDSYLNRRVFTKKDMEKITCPVMFVQGSEDVVVPAMNNPVVTAIEWMSNVKNAPAPIIKIENAGLSVLNRPQFNRMVAQFINRNWSS